MEQTNFRYVTPEDIPDALDFASVDVSFISLTKILIPARNLLKTGGQMMSSDPSPVEPAEARWARTVW